MYLILSPVLMPISLLVQSSAILFQSSLCLLTASSLLNFFLILIFIASSFRYKHGHELLSALAILSNLVFRAIANSATALDMHELFDTTAGNISQDVKARIDEFHNQFSFPSNAVHAE